MRVYLTCPCVDEPAQKCTCVAVLHCHCVSVRSRGACTLLLCAQPQSPLLTTDARAYVPATPHAPAFAPTLHSVMLPQGRTHVSNLRMGTMFYICPAVVCQVRGCWSAMRPGRARCKL